MRNFTVIVKSQKIQTNSFSYKMWVERRTDRTIHPDRTAVVISDMWDKHWSTGGTARVGMLADKINHTIQLLRNKGLLIVHCPSDTMDFYQNSNARQKLLAEPFVQPEIIRDIVRVPVPIDHSDGGSDTFEHDKPDTRVWTRQNEKIEIDQDRDLIADGDEGDRVYSYMKNRNMDTIMYMGVHTNFCVLGRSFGIRTMSSWGMNCILFEDLTDAMYNPERSPYVSHEEGTKLVVHYIEKFYCPTTSSVLL